MFYLLSLLQLFVCVALIFFVLIQSNKGMGLAGAFGSVGGSDSVFASGGMNILVKITIGLAVVFALNSLALTIITPPGGQRSLLDDDANIVGPALSELVEQSQSGGETTLPAQGGDVEQAAPQE
ncbi:MAG: preprotein translocase subunit SecG [Candidatus Hinthialibacter antarcticus]|nr:preprotein translocase subunit SecG [Candidatus Hinthialibacter antarcticus]